MIIGDATSKINSLFKMWYFCNLFWFVSTRESYLIYYFQEKHQKIKLKIRIIQRKQKYLIKMCEQ